MKTKTKTKNLKKLREIKNSVESRIEPALLIQNVRRAAFNEAYDKFVECEDGNAYTKWLNKVCG